MNIKLPLKKIGTFEIKSGKIRVSDPCYSPDTWCATTINVKKGTWSAHQLVTDEGDWGKRVAGLAICHESFSLNKAFEIDSWSLKDEGLSWMWQWQLVDADIGVDSGQCGFFDYEEFIRLNSGHDPLLNEMCFKNSCDELVVLPFGVGGSCGYGDGSYICHVIKQNGVVVAAFLDYLDVLSRNVELAIVQTAKQEDLPTLLGDVLRCDESKALLEQRLKGK